MFGKNKQDAPKSDAAKSPKSVNFEISIADLARRSEKRAWMVTGAAIVMSLILAGGYFYMLPLKKIEPYMIMADPYSGAAYVSKLQGDYNFKTLTTQEAVQRSNLVHYIVARESFDFDITRNRDWDMVHLMSEGGVALSYTQMHASDNPQAPARLFGRDRSLRIKVTNARPNGTRTGSSPESPIYMYEATFQRTIYDKRTDQESLLDTKRAMVEFEYKNLALNDAQRYDNPLGFRVVAYRVDGDGSETQPIAPPSANPPPVDPYAVPGAVPAPAGGVPGQLPPGGAVPGQALPGQALPGQAVPSQAVPGQAVPGQAPPAQPQPGQPPPSSQQVPSAPQFGSPSAPAAQPVARPQPATQPAGVR
jgi:type IV secretion system protein VirB8